MKASEACLWPTIGFGLNGVRKGLEVGVPRLRYAVCG